MKNLWKFSLIAFAMLSLVSCEDDDAKNMEPTIPTTLSPANEAENVAKTITLNWKTSEDPEKTMVKYTLFIGTKAELTDEDIKAKDLAETKYEITLNGHTTYFWKVVANDAEGLTAESAVFSFTTDNSAPAKSVGSFPAHEAVDVAKTVAFAWTAATDADGDVIKYDLYVAETNVFADADKKATDITESTFEVADLKAHTQYFWKVVAKDVQAVSVESDVYSFTTLNALPTKSEITEVTEKLVEGKIQLEIKWAASTDADGDAVSYDLYLSADDVFDASDIVATDLAETEYLIEDASGYTNYSIKVESKDGVASVSTETKMHQTQMIEGEIYLEEGTFTDVRDSHEYKTVTINGTTWMAENLAYLPFFADPDADEKKCSVYGLPIVKPRFGGDDWTMPSIEDAKAHENFAKYGVMYSAYMLEDLAPEGWHVATDEEWMALEKLSGMSDTDIDWTSYRGTTLHKFLSKTSTWANNPAPTDEFGLDIKPGGYNKVLEDAGENAYTYFWTNSFTNNPFTGSKSYWNRAFSGSKTGVNRGKTKSSTYRMYVRLVKDSE